MGAGKILIVYEHLERMKYVLHGQSPEEEKILYLTPEQEKDKFHFNTKETGKKQQYNLENEWSIGERDLRPHIDRSSIHNSKKLWNLSRCLPTNEWLKEI